MPALLGACCLPRELIDQLVHQVPRVALHPAKRDATLPHDLDEWLPQVSIDPGSLSTRHRCTQPLDRRARHDPGRACLVGKGHWPAAEDQRFPMSQGPGADQRYVLMTPKACAFCHALTSSRQ